MRSEAWTGVVRSATHLDRSKLALIPAARCAAGIAVPLVAGELSGHLLAGVVAAIGALTTGTASLQGAYRSRVKIMCLAAVAFAVSAFVGATAGHLLGVDVAVTAAWAFAGGIVVLFGPAAGVVGLQAVLGLVIFSQFDFGVMQAASNAGWALCGGALQIVFVAVIWPLQRFPVERQASGTAYRLLASHVRSLVSDPGLLLDPKVLDDLRAAVSETQPLGDPAVAAAYRALADEAARIRLEAAGVARSRALLEASGRGPGGAGSQAGVRLDNAILATANVLDEAADALRDGRPALLSGPEDRREFRRALADLRSTVETAAPQEQALLAQAIGGLTALAGQIRSVAQLTGVAAGGEPTDPTGPSPAAAGPLWRRPRRLRSPSLRRGWPGRHLRPGLPLRRAPGSSQLEAIRANLTLRSEAFRHALRVAVAMGIAVAVSHLFSFGHGYWLPMTVMIILKPDFAATFSRGLARSVGTLLGAGLATLVLAGLRPPPAVLIALTVALYALCIAVLLANYAIYSVGIAALVVVLLAFTGAPAASLAVDRGFYTVLGAALALAAYAIWPTWERRRVPDRLADLVDTDGRYGAALLAAWADPAAADRAELDRLRMAARLARSNAEASVTRWRSEPAGRAAPERGGLDADTAEGILAAIRRYVWGALALHGQLPEVGPPRPLLSELAGEVRDALTAVAESLRSGSTTSNYPPLRATQVALAETLVARSSDGGGSDSDPGGAGGTPHTQAGGAHLASPDMVLVTETDLMVNAVDTLAHLAGIKAQPQAARR